MTVGNDSMFENLVNDFSKVEKDENKNVDVDEEKVTEDSIVEAEEDKSGHYEKEKCPDCGKKVLTAFGEDALEKHIQAEEEMGGFNFTPDRAQYTKEICVCESKTNEAETPFSPNETSLNRTIGTFRKVEDDPNKNIDEGKEVITPAQCTTPFEKVLESCQQVKESSDLVDIANAKLGWAVAEQLKSILDNPSADGIEDAELNSNAVRMIYQFVSKREDKDSLEVQAAIEDWVEADYGDPSVLEAVVEEEVVDESYGSVYIKADLHRGMSKEKVIQKLQARYPDIGDEEAGRIVSAVEKGEDWPRRESVEEVDEGGKTKDQAASELFGKRFEDLTDEEREDVNSNVKEEVEEVVKEEVVDEMALSGNKYKVTAQAFDRESDKPSGEKRDEVIDITSNEVFKNVKNLGDIEAAYERFWNKLNPKSKDTVKVFSVQAVDEAVEEEVVEGLQSSDKDIFIGKSSDGDGWSVLRAVAGSNMSSAMFTFDTSEEAAEAGEKIAAAIGGNFHGDKDPQMTDEPQREPDRADIEDPDSGIDYHHEARGGSDGMPDAEMTEHDWPEFMEKYGFTEVEIDKFAQQMGFADYKDMDQSIDPTSLRKEDEEKFEAVLADFVGSTDESVEEGEVKEEVAADVTKEDIEKAIATARENYKKDPESSVWPMLIRQLEKQRSEVKEEVVTEEVVDEKKIKDYSDRELQDLMNKISKARGWDKVSALMDELQDEIGRRHRESEPNESVKEAGVDEAVIDEKDISRKKEWFIHILEEGDWPIKYDGDSKEEAKAVYLKWAEREKLPVGSRIWSRDIPQKAKK